MQAEEINSLKAQLETVTEVAEKTRILLTLSYELRNQNSLSAYQYGIEALQLAESLGDIQLIGEAKIYTGTAVTLLGKFEEALKYLTEGRELLEKTNDTQCIALAYQNIGSI
jgi:hypothetical protein